MTAMLFTDRDKINNIYRGHSIDASYQVFVHLAKWFQWRRFKCEKIPDDRCQVMAKAHMAFRPSYLIKRFKLENLEELEFCPYP
jgi:hypothetical protein